ncbi:MAG: 16S rRNA (guanine(527)-N(7))-methyltransferase RsmG [Anaerolineae bacterium]
MMELLASEASGIGLTLTQAHLAAFEIYYRELAAWNQRFNLTTITGYEDVQIKHLLDSLMCILAFPDYGTNGVIPSSVPLLQQDYELRCADIGSGAGFPGIPLKILYPGLRLTLIEATHKKTLFLRHMVEVLNLQQVSVVNSRAEELGQDALWREQFDLVVARAVAGLSVLAEYCLPLVRVGGRWIAQKGEDAEAEVEAAEYAIRTLGGKPIAIKKYQLHQVSSPRHLVVVEKITTTPEVYPRRAGIPSKRPL